MRFGGLKAVDELSFRRAAGDITAVIGPNGAGKTTVFNCITGFYRPTAGAHRADPCGRPDHSRWSACPATVSPPRAKVARTFQNIRLFAGMTVLENLLVAQHNVLMGATGFGVLAVLGLGRYRAAEAAGVEKARFWLDAIGLTGARRRSRRRPALWRATPAGNRPRDVHRPGAAVPGRARRRPEPARDRGAEPAAAAHPRPAAARCC